MKTEKKKIYTIYECENVFSVEANSVMKNLRNIVVCLIHTRMIFFFYRTNDSK